MPCRLDVPPTMQVHYYSRIVSLGEMPYNLSLEIFALVIEVYVITYQHAGFQEKLCF